MDNYLPATYDPYKKEFKLIQGVSHASTLQFFCNQTIYPVKVILKDYNVLDVNGAVIRVFSPFVNSILSEVCDSNYPPQLILSEIEGECFSNLIKILLDGQIVTTDPSKSMNQILELAHCLQINMKNLSTKTLVVPQSSKSSELSLISATQILKPTNTCSVITSGPYKVAYPKSVTSANHSSIVEAETQNSVNETGKTSTATEAVQSNPANIQALTSKSSTTDNNNSERAVKKRPGPWSKTKVDSNIQHNGDVDNVIDLTSADNCPPTKNIRVAEVAKKFTNDQVPNICSTNAEKRRSPKNLVNNRKKSKKMISPSTQIIKVYPKDAATKIATSISQSRGNAVVLVPVSKDVIAKRLNKNNNNKLSQPSYSNIIMPPVPTRASENLLVESDLLRSKDWDFGSIPSIVSKNWGNGAKCTMMESESTMREKENRKKDDLMAMTNFLLNSLPVDKRKEQTCLVCSKSFLNMDELLGHLDASGHGDTRECKAKFENL